MFTPVQCVRVTAAGALPRPRERGVSLSVVMNRYRVMLTAPIYIPKLYDGRNRTFFTYAYDHLYRSTGTVTPQSVPTAAERRGDFSALALGSEYQIYDPATIAPAGKGTFSRSPLPGNIIPPSRLDPIAQKLIGYYPLPNVVGTPDGLNNFSSSPLSVASISKSSKYMALFAQDPIQAAAQANYAKNPIPEIPANAFQVKGGCCSLV